LIFAALLTQILSQIFILLGGALLVQNNQLSLGQFVAVELIFSAITASINKAPKFLETHYDLITSLKKIKHATGAVHEN
jgi:ABC-type bacteriocin/lantibiotic exporter with double-glycine peptidase domain